LAFYHTASHGVASHEVIRRDKTFGADWKQAALTATPFANKVGKLGTGNTPFRESFTRERRTHSSAENKRKRSITNVLRICWRHGAADPTSRFEVTSDSHEELLGVLRPPNIPHQESKR
jgi:hypothetical protein